MSERFSPYLLKTFVGSAALVFFAACGKGPGNKAAGGKPVEEIPRVPTITSVDDGDTTYFPHAGDTIEISSGGGHVTISGTVESNVDKVTSNDLVGAVDFDAASHLFTLRTTILYGETRTITFLSFAGTASNSAGTSITIAYAPIIKLPLLSQSTLAVEKAATGAAGKSAKILALTTMGSLGGTTSTGATGYQILTGPTMLMLGQ